MDQHWVPKSYLAVWFDAECPQGYTPYVWKAPKDGGAGQRKSPANIFKEAEFYTISLPDGQRDLSLEHGLASLEGSFCNIRDTLIASRQPFSKENKVWFCAFMAAMRHRTRASRNAFQQQWGHVARVAEDLQHALDRMTPVQRQQYRPTTSLGPKGPSLSIANVKQLAAEPIQNMLPGLIEKEVPLLARMNLVIFTTDNEIGFIASDHPCVAFDPEHPNRHPLMLESRTIEVSMPVSPSTLAVLCWEELPNYVDAAPSIVMDANRLRLLACEKYTVARRNVTNGAWTL